jgi:hypothetical protein
MAKGGARPGAGRKKGSTTRPQLRDQLTQKQIDALVAKGLERAEAGDSIILKFLLEQVFGKAPQPLTGADGGAIEIKGVEITVRKK